MLEESRHIFRENNAEADAASKEGLTLGDGIWKIAESLNGNVQVFFHRPFIE